jgi:hypothetical protein
MFLNLRTELTFTAPSGPRLMRSPASSGPILSEGRQRHCVAIARLFPSSDWSALKTPLSSSWMPRPCCARILAWMV